MYNCCVLAIKKPDTLVAHGLLSLFLYPEMDFLYCEWILPYLG